MAYSNFSKVNSFEKFVGIVYTCWVGFWFVIIFVGLFPIYWVALQKEKWKPFAHQLNRIWGKILFLIIGMKVEVDYQFMPDKKGTYVFVSNHFSYWDIATLGVIIDNYYAFVGKSSVKKIPLLGYMFTKLHIQVDRSEKGSRAISMTRAMKALKKNRSMMMFAEGGIVTRNPPQMAKAFKEGAFLMAIQNQVPIVPITLLNNHQIIWDEDLIMKRLPVKAIVHKPISTIGMKTSNMDELKEKTWNTIQNELNRYHGIDLEVELEKNSKI
ncbi:MAG: lysophospholipid acyltransferase family protein [Bacteroidota bacterium]